MQLIEVDDTGTLIPDFAVWIACLDSPKQQVQSSPSIKLLKLDLFLMEHTFATALTRVIWKQVSRPAIWFGKVRPMSSDSMPFLWRSKLHWQYQRRRRAWLHLGVCYWHLLTTFEPCHFLKPDTLGIVLLKLRSFHNQQEPDILYPPSSFLSLILFDFIYLTSLVSIFEKMTSPNDSCPKRPFQTTKIWNSTQGHDFCRAKCLGDENTVVLIIVTIVIFLGRIFCPWDSQFFRHDPLDLPPAKKRKTWPTNEGRGNPAKDNPPKTTFQNVYSGVKHARGWQVSWEFLDLMLFASRLVRVELLVPRTVVKFQLRPWQQWQHTSVQADQGKRVEGCGNFSGKFIVSMLWGRAW